MSSLNDDRRRYPPDAAHAYAICCLDPSGVILSWNAGAQQLTGYCPDEIVGQSFAQLYTPEDRMALHPVQALRAVAEDQDYEHEAWRSRRDGTRFWAHTVMHAIRDAAGAVVGVAMVTREARHRNDELAAVGDWGDQAAKTETIGRLAGKVAHEFNNVLAAISGNLEIAQNRLKSGRPIDNLLGNAMSAAAKAADLTTLMLASARRQTLRPGPVNVAGVVECIVEGAHAQISIDQSAALQDNFAQADAVAFEKALAALVRNAVDATATGGDVRIGIRHTLTEHDQDGLQPGSYVVVTVTDTGHGMTDETRRKAVEPFFTTKAADRGAGLGLSMAEGFAVQSGGALVLRSHPDVGTEVELWLPTAQHAERNVAPDDALAVVPRRTGDIALVVDDDPSVLDATSGLLEELGYRTITARSGQDALTRLIDHREITVLVTDDAMPGMTGAELAAQVERVRPGLGVLLVSGYMEPRRRQTVGPAVNFLGKPFDLKQLSAALADLAGMQALRPKLQRISRERGSWSRLASATLDRDQAGDT